MGQTHTHAHRQYKNMMAPAPIGGWGLKAKKVKPWSLLEKVCAVCPCSLCLTRPCQGWVFDTQSDNAAHCSHTAAPAGVSAVSFLEIAMTTDARRCAPAMNRYRRCEYVILVSWGCPSHATAAALSVDERSPPRSLPWSRRRQSNTDWCRRRRCCFLDDTLLAALRRTC